MKIMPAELQARTGHKNRASYNSNNKEGPRHMRATCYANAAPTLGGHQWRASTATEEASRIAAYVANDADAGAYATNDADAGAYAAATVPPRPPPAYN